MQEYGRPASDWVQNDWSVQKKIVAVPCRDGSQRLSHFLRKVALLRTTASERRVDCQCSGHFSRERPIKAGAQRTGTPSCEAGWLEVFGRSAEESTTLFISGRKSLEGRATGTKGGCALQYLLGRRFFGGRILCCFRIREDRRHDLVSTLRIYVQLGQCRTNRHAGTVGEAHAEGSALRARVF